MEPSIRFLSYLSCASIFFPFFFSAIFHKKVSFGEKKKSSKKWTTTITTQDMTKMVPSRRLSWKNKLLMIWKHLPDGSGYRWYEVTFLFTYSEPLRNGKTVWCNSQGKHTTWSYWICNNVGTVESSMSPEVKFSRKGVPFLFLFQLTTWTNFGDVWRAMNSTVVTRWILIKFHSLFVRTAGFHLQVKSQIQVLQIDHQWLK